MFAPQRSQSGSGLSINVGAANTASATTQPASGGLFSSKPAAASLFGASTTTTAPTADTLFSTNKSTTGGPSLFGATSSAPSQAGTLFGGSAAAATQPQTTSLFGNAATTTQPQTTSLFGNTATTTQPSLFGNSTNPSQPAASNSLFGGTNPQTQTQTTSLFGNTTTAPSQPQTTNLFGAIKPQQPLMGTNQSQPATSSLFGNTTTQPTQSTSIFGAPAQPAGTSLFGNSTIQAGQGAQNKGLFGTSQNTQGSFQQSTLNPAQRTQRSIFSSSIGAYTAEQQTVPGVRINLHELRLTTRFNDLYEGVQKEIEGIDTFISSQIKLAEECEAMMPSNSATIASIPADVEICSGKLDALERSLEADAVAIEDAKKLAKKDADAARLSFKAISAIRMPAHLQSNSFRTTTNLPIITGTSDDSANSSDLLSYFNSQTDDMSTKLDLMKRQIAEVESYLSSMESQQIAQIQSTRLSHGRDGGVKSAEDQIKEMARALQSFEGGILNVAARLTGTRESLGGLIVGEGRGGWR